MRTVLSISKYQNRIKKWNWSLGFVQRWISHLMEVVSSSNSKYWRFRIKKCRTAFKRMEVVTASVQTNEKLKRMGWSFKSHSFGRGWRAIRLASHSFEWAIRLRRFQTNERTVQGLFNVYSSDSDPEFFDTHGTISSSFLKKKKKGVFSEKFLKPKFFRIY